MILHCTQKLLSELKVKPAAERPVENPFLSWHANTFHIDRRKCILVTNDTTLFSLFIPALKKPDFQSFEFFFGQYLFKNLLHEGLPQDQIEKVLSALNEIQYRKTNNRSVLGSMNIQRNLLETIVQDEGGLARTDIYGLNHTLNRNILSAIGYGYPIELFVKQLESL